MSENNLFGNTLKIEAVVIPNGIEEKKFKILSKISSIKNLDSKLNVLYAGNIGIAQKLSTIIDCADQLNNFNFKIIGEGIEKNL